MHFHSPSEHTVDGKNYDLELHMVHTDIFTGAPAAVLGIFFSVNDTAADNIFLDEIVPDLYNFDLITNQRVGSVKLATFLE